MCTTENYDFPYRDAYTIYPLTSLTIANKNVFTKYTWTYKNFELVKSM